MHGCGKWRHRQGASLCFKASVFILSLPDRVVCSDLDATPCTFCVSCVLNQVGGTCVWVACGAHCQSFQGPNRHSTRSLSTPSLASFSLSAGCHPTSRGCGRRRLRVSLFVFVSLFILFFLFFVYSTPLWIGLGHGLCADYINGQEHCMTKCRGYAPGQEM